MRIFTRLTKAVNGGSFFCCECLPLVPTANRYPSNSFAIRDEPDDTLLLLAPPTPGEPECRVLNPRT